MKNNMSAAALLHPTDKPNQPYLGHRAFINVNLGRSREKRTAVFLFEYLRKYRKFRAPPYTRVRGKSRI